MWEGGECTPCRRENNSFVCLTWLIYMCDTTHACVWMTHSWVWHYSLGVHGIDEMTRIHIYHSKSVTRLIHMCDLTHWAHILPTDIRFRAKLQLVCTQWVMSHSSTPCHIWISHITLSTNSHLASHLVAISVHSIRHGKYEWVMAHMDDSCHVVDGIVWQDSWSARTLTKPLIAYMSHDSFIFGTWLIHMWDLTHSYVGHNWFICETWLIHMCDMTHPHVWHDSCRVIDRIGNPIRHVKYGWALGLLAKWHLVCTQNYRSLLRISALS